MRAETELTRFVKVRLAHEERKKFRSELTS